ncbi:polysaccharide deacetylase family protein [Fibrella forsythiae]|uniref:Polysaccharide deacetylase family protein n=1 Tax=Fibrella forsythiae TaxID=2817061 RepID=A0ABS3JKF7_9BACT|nr:polysaccharide deacetylase family protein [Fibrella forsythiae]MBO0950500.1 polysaccharide deacetylase family protein [Fibrella forsythiae]
MKLPALLILTCLLLYWGEAVQAQKQICITIDDLPTVSSLYRTPAGKALLTSKLLAHLKQYNVPAIGFVVGEKLMSQSKPDKNQLELVAQWLAAGMELGNHTYAHLGYNTISAATYQQDVMGVDTLLHTLLKSVNQRPRYFRHPYLQRGNTVGKRDSLVHYLATHAYLEAPVSIDNADYIFSAAYDVALLRKDTALASAVGKQYVDYMANCVHYYEAQADSLFKRPIAHILLTHANTINSDYMGSVFVRLQAEGYSFITLEQALRDPAYQSQDDYVNNGGISWLHRWALTQGKRGAFFKGEPDVPDAVTRLAEGR